MRLRHTSISADSNAAAQQLGENARDANRALTFGLSGYYAEVRGYAAIGSSDARISLSGSTAKAVLCVLARETHNPVANVQLPAALNFAVIGGSLSVFEPAGLTTNELYDLTFLVLE